MKSIVVVDDSSFCRELLALALQFGGLEVRAAASGFEALPLMQRCKPDLVILGLKLPDMDGLKTLRLIRGSSLLKNVPVFILSEEDNRVCIVQATQIGIQAYILKSQFKLDAFLKRVQDQLGTSTGATTSASAIEEVWGTIN